MLEMVKSEKGVNPRHALTALFFAYSDEFQSVFPSTVRGGAAADGGASRGNRRRIHRRLTGDRQIQNRAEEGFRVNRG